MYNYVTKVLQLKSYRTIEWKLFLIYKQVFWNSVSLEYALDILKRNNMKRYVFFVVLETLMQLIYDHNLLLATGTGWKQHF